CHTFKYFDVNVSFDQGIDDGTLGSISRCRVLVTGAESSSFVLERCPNRATNGDPHQVGVFEYSSFAESGTLNFELRAYTGLNETPACLLAEGTAAIPVTAATTLMGTLAAKQMGTGCPNVSPVSDAGP
ncbi:MAG TPA: hypothetical protein VG319_06060, partial [Polyangia bacterium]|nr:hypothetical protein [Polyangia bacterium]